MPMVLVVRADSPYTTLAELVQAARAQPMQVKQALAGLGTVGHLAGELLAWQGQFKVLNVPYKGAAPAVTDLMGANTDYMFASPQAVLKIIQGARLRALAVTSPTRLPVLPGYQSEINFRAESWVRQMGGWLRRGAALIIDYGFPRHEYYHPQRMQGSLMCHFRHHAHAHPLVLAGLQDVTAHVDFTAVAQAAREGGLAVLGYTSQANFLMNAGLLELLNHMSTEDTVHYSRAAGAVQRLVSEAEMGELFKVMALGRGLTVPLLGFARSDRRSRLGLGAS